MSELALATGRTRGTAKRVVWIGCDAAWGSRNARKRLIRNKNLKSFFMAHSRNWGDRFRLFRRNSAVRFKASKRDTTLRLRAFSTNSPARPKFSRIGLRAWLI